MATTLGDVFVHQLDQELGELHAQLERLALTNPNTTPALSAQERKRWEHHYARLRRRVEDRARLAEKIGAAYSGPEGARLRKTMKRTVDLLTNLLVRPPEDGLLSEQMLELQAQRAQLLQLKQQLGVAKVGASQSALIAGPTNPPASDPVVALALGATLIVDLIGALLRGRRPR